MKKMKLYKSMIVLAIIFFIGASTLRLVAEYPRQVMEYKVGEPQEVTEGERILIMSDCKDKGYTEQQINKVADDLDKGIDVSLYLEKSDVNNFDSVRNSVILDYEADSIKDMYSSIAFIGAVMCVIMFGTCIFGVYTQVSKDTNNEIG